MSSRVANRALAHEARSIQFERAAEHRRPASLRRWGGLVGGSALAWLGLKRRSKAGAALAAAGGLLVYAGTKARAIPKLFAARSSVVVNCSPQEAFQFLRKLENLPLFMRHLETVTVLDGGRSKWIALGPLGRPIEWYAETVAERPNELLAWRSLPDSDLTVDGAIELRKMPANRGTLVRATVIYTPPTGALGQAIAKVLGKDPNFLMRQDLRRFKALVETGEIPTTEGQTHGPRSGVVALARMLDRDRPIRPGANVREVIRAKRSVS